ncbi:MAG TPA: hypothetical protein VJZ93_01220 [Candidatus Nanoarchaeia archaeon]|nr:hypothetical protein [Candidatus Nanoarchaeia archaeon]
MPLKSLKPSLRENKRYLLVKGKDVNKIEKVILEFIGVLGFSKTGLSWIKREKDSAVICINREAVNEIQASFAASKEDISVKKVSGTLRGLRN